MGRGEGNENGRKGPAESAGMKENNRRKENGSLCKKLKGETGK